MALTPEEQVEMEELQAGSGGTSEPPISNPAQDLINAGKTGVGVLQKLSGALRAGSSGPATRSILESLSGKKLKVPPHAGLGMDLQTYPSNDELFKQAGYRNPLLSDLVNKIAPVYAEKGSQHSSWQPEKEGFFDPGVAGVIQTATDPAMYTGLAEGALAAKGIPWAAKAMGLVDKVANPLSMVARGTGKMAYDSALLPLEQQGVRKGKDAIAETLYQGGVKSPFGLQGKAQKVVDQLELQRNAILGKAGAAGGVSSMEEAMAPLKARIAEIRAKADPLSQPAADKLEAKMNKYLANERDTPAVPPTPRETTLVDSPIWDTTENKPFQTEKVVNPGSPGSPAVPGKKYSPLEGSDMKSSVYNSQPISHFNEAAPSEIEQSLNDTLSGGLRSASQSAVDRSLGPKAAASVGTLNKKMGGVISTKTAQNTISERAGRKADQLILPSPADIMTGVMGAGMGWGTGVSPAKMAALALIAKKATNVLDVSRMPLGYATRKVGDSRALDRLMELIKNQNNPGEKK